MINVSVSQLVNQVDNGQFTLYVEWEDTYFKIILLRSCTVPLKGEMHTESASYFLEQLEEPLETYLEKTKQAFSGKNTDIQFFLQDDTFTWKQQNILTRGEITVHPLSNVLIVSDTLKELLERYQDCQERIVTLEKENECLNKTNGKLITDVETMIDMKNKMEKDLYGKFLLLLNTKKERIRELQKIIDGNKQVTKSAYDETTDDESEGSNGGSKKTCDTKKRKNEQKTEPKSSKRNFKRRTNSFSSDSTSPEPSTSKDERVLRSTDARHTIQPKQLPNTPEEESEEDLFSQ
ncbi:DNA repair protein XRCC4 isoform X2 [Ooceraea biroi]|uniref:DNA repair protein XRCC4 n=2 Tax=Ooceraea biroi TaxID=2015173 RepID=A0A026X0N6_OOCBI|nr:DNA repair protein XRCC4 isoform X2 [Ooceraea biroi]XP_011347597.1 DNA repair protein XRCC4 isoform X2 [Ooceraea biroi]EZA61566.1 DNA repair protein XRCC4 [Ooceraea biroi]